MRPASAVAVLPGHLDSVRVARRVVAEALDHGGAAPADVDRSVLCASELVTNAVVHAAGEVRLAVLVEFDRVRVEVTDDGDPVRWDAATSPAGVRNGHGLRIIAALARAWGSAPSENGKTMWCELRPEGEEEQ